MDEGIYLFFTFLRFSSASSVLPVSAKKYALSGRRLQSNKIIAGEESVETQTAILYQGASMTKSRVGTVEKSMRYLHPSESMTRYPRRASKKAPNDQAKVIPRTKEPRRGEGRNSAQIVIIYGI